MRFGRVLLIVAFVMVGSCSATAQSRLDGWAAAIIAADWRTSDGQPIQAFDNARRDLTAGFLAAGFRRENTIDLTLRPDVDDPVDVDEAIAAVSDVTARATDGCLLYFTSHGSPEFMVFGPDAELDPTTMASLVRRWCGPRPTVVVISACFSGIFADGLEAPNRMIVTAARRDRTSFGCSEEATYPYFDGCMIESLPDATDFIALAQAARRCVSRREEAEGLTPPSQPQVRIGANMQMRLPTLRFAQAPP